MDVVVTAAEDQTKNSGGIVIQGEVPPSLCSSYQRPDKKTSVHDKLFRFARDIIFDNELQNGSMPLHG